MSVRLTASAAARRWLHPHGQGAMLADPCAGQSLCGDIVARLSVAAGPGQGDTEWLVVIDGLGHGPAAAAAARCALASLQTAAAAPQAAAADPGALLRRLDAALEGTRGAALGIVCRQGDRLWHAGVGNTRALRWRAGEVLRLPSRWGIVGDGRLRDDVAPPVQQLDLQAGDWLLLFSDGLDEALRLGASVSQTPAQLCDDLLARWRNPADDAAVLAWRHGASADLGSAAGAPDACTTSDDGHGRPA